MAALRTYQPVLREAEREDRDYGTFFVTKFDLFNEDPAKVRRVELVAASLDELDARIQEVFDELTAWEYGTFYVDVLDGNRKPNGFKARYERGRVLKRATAQAQEA